MIFGGFDEHRRTRQMTMMGTRGFFVREREEEERYKGIWLGEGGVAND